MFSFLSPTQKERESQGPAVPPEKKDFEGMKLTQEEIDRIKAIRTQAEVIKVGIEPEHMNSYDDLVNAFKIALGRAERERDLDKSLSKRLL